MSAPYYAVSLLAACTQCLSLCFFCQFFSSHQTSRFFFPSSSNGAALNILFSLPQSLTYCWAPSRSFHINLCPCLICTSLAPSLPPSFFFFYRTPFFPLGSAANQGHVLLRWYAPPVPPPRLLRPAQCHYKCYGGPTRLSP